eukprot:SAG11_NODE_3526_length_2392_cov_2.698212_1_plen_201_part_00
MYPDASINSEFSIGWQKPKPGPDPPHKQQAPQTAATMPHGYNIVAADEWSIEEQRPVDVQTTARNRNERGFNIVAPPAIPDPVPSRHPIEWGGAGQRVEHPVAYEAAQQRSRWLSAEFQRLGGARLNKGELVMWARTLPHCEQFHQQREVESAIARLLEKCERSFDNRVQVRRNNWHESWIQGSKILSYLVALCFAHSKG